MLNERYMEKLKESWWKKKITCSKVEDQQDGISIANIGGVFIVIFVGIGFACVTLFVEYWWYKYKHRSKIINVTSVDNVMETGRSNLNVVETNQSSSTIIGHARQRNTAPIRIVD